MGFAGQLRPDAALAERRRRAGLPGQGFGKAGGHHRLFALSVTPPTSCTPPVNAQGVYEFSGTSAACPMVGAAAALMLSLNQGLTWLEVRDLLRQTAQVVDVANGQWSNHRSYWYGSGRLDVNA